MTTRPTPMSWSARFLIGLILLLIGAGASAWAFARYPAAARLMGISTPRVSAIQAPAGSRQASDAAVRPAAVSMATDTRVAQLEARLAQVEAKTQNAAGSAGRADALLVAFAARRAVDRGVALGYLENLLVQRFGGQHRAAVATVITASRRPIRLQDLQTEYDGLGPTLRRGGKTSSMWSSIGRELGSLIEVRRGDHPPADIDARYRRAQQQLGLGRVDTALAETMRMPGASDARDWIDKARRYSAVQRALDELESAALLGSGRAS